MAHSLLMGLLADIESALDLHAQPTAQLSSPQAYQQPPFNMFCQ